jgi:hypothetical protein
LIHLSDILDDHVLKGCFGTFEEVGEVLSLVLGSNGSDDWVALVQELLNSVAISVSFGPY